MTSPFDDTVALATSELLASVATQGAGRCFLLIDPELRPILPEDEDWQHYADLAHTPVPIGHRDVNETSYPVLTPLRLAVDAERELLVHTVREACIEMQPQALRTGQGRRIGGWLISDAPVHTIASELGQVMLQRHPSGGTVWLRFQDPAVLWVMSGWLPALQQAALQQAALLGSVRTFHVLTPAMQLLSLQSTEARDGAELDLTDAQWSAIELVGPLNTALRDREIFGPDQLPVARRNAFAAIRRAKAMGFHDGADLALYGGCALWRHPRFDFHPLMVARLKARPPGGFFSALIEGLTERDWERMRQEVPAASTAPV